MAVSSASLVLFTPGDLNKYQLNHGNEVLLLIEVNQSYCDCEGFYYQIQQVESVLDRYVLAF